jgi:fatty-acyl-CoA synthase
MSDTLSALRARRHFVRSALEGARRKWEGGDGIEAGRILRAVLHGDPQHLDALLMLGTIEKSAGNLSGCLELLAAAQKVAPDDPGLGINLFNGVMAAMNRAAMSADKGDHDAAAELYAAVVGIQPEQAQAREKLAAWAGFRSQAAMNAYNQGDLAQAAVLSRKVLELSPEHADAWLVAGAVAWRRGECEEAISAFQRAAPSSRQARDVLAGLADELLGRATAATAADDWATAVECYNALRSASPAAADALDAERAPRTPSPAVAAAWALIDLGWFGPAVDALRDVADDPDAQSAARTAQAESDCLVGAFLAAAADGASPLMRRIADAVTTRDGIFLRRVGGDRAELAVDYRGLIAAALRRAQGFAGGGVGPGDAVALALEDPAELFAAMVGAMLIGATPAVFAHPSPKVTPTDFAANLAGALDALSPRMVVCDPQHAPAVSAVTGRRIETIADLTAATRGAPPPPIFTSSRDTAFLQFTSGTTGLKKGVAVSETALLWQIDVYGRSIGLSPDDHVVSWLPFYHDMGLLTALMLPLIAAVPVTLMSPFVWAAEPALLLRTISRFRGTLCWLPNFAYAFMARSVSDAQMEGVDLSSLRGVVNCSEPIRPASHAVFVARFERRGFRREMLAASYAMAENTFAVTSGGFGSPVREDRIDPVRLLPGAPVAAGDAAVASSGTPLPGVDVAILAEDGTPLAERVLGEIAIAGPCLFNGYRRNEAATREAFSGRWYRTGDYGYLDDGELFVTGRKKDLLIVSGRNVHPQDVEATVGDIPGVAPGRVAVVGVEDETLGTQALVVLAETRETDPAFRSQLAGKVAAAVVAVYDVAPRDVRILDHMWLRKSSSGKISRRINRDRYLAERAAAAPTEPTEPAGTAAAEQSGAVGLVLRALAAAADGLRPTSAEEKLFSTGRLNSLGLVSLVVALEEALGRRLPSPAEVGFDAYDSVAAIVALIEGDDATVRGPAGDKPDAVAAVTDRQVKTAQYLASPRDFDTIVFGSSRTFAISARGLSAYGLKGFHFGANAMMAEEFYAVAALLFERTRTPIKTALIGIDAESFNPHLPLDPRFLACRDLLAHLDAEDREGAGGLPHTPSRVKSGSDRLLSYWTELQHRDWGKRGAGFDRASGDYVSFDWAEIETRRPVKIRESAVGDAYTLYLARQVDRLHAKRLDYFRRFLDMLRGNGVDARVFINPTHKILHVGLGSLPAAKAQTELAAMLAGRASTDPGLRFYDFATPEAFGGLDDDFTTDGRHLGFFNADALVAAIFGGEPGAAQVK